MSKIYRVDTDLNSYNQGKHSYFFTEKEVAKTFITNIVKKIFSQFDYILKIESSFSDEEEDYKIIENGGIIPHYSFRRPHETKKENPQIGNFLLKTINIDGNIGNKIYKLRADNNDSSCAIVSFHRSEIKAIEALEKSYFQTFLVPENWTKSVCHLPASRYLKHLERCTGKYIISLEKKWVYKDITHDDGKLSSIEEITLDDEISY